MYLQDTERLAENKNKCGESGVLGAKKRRPNNVRSHVREETDSFTYIISKMGRLKRPYTPSHIKLFDESKDPEDHIKIF